MRRGAGARPGSRAVARLGSPVTSRCIPLGTTALCHCSLVLCVGYRWTYLVQAHGLYTGLFINASDEYLACRPGGPVGEEGRGGMESFQRAN